MSSTVLHKIPPLDTQPKVQRHQFFHDDRCYCGICVVNRRESTSQPFCCPHNMLDGQDRYLLACMLEPSYKHGLREAHMCPVCKKHMHDKYCAVCTAAVDWANEHDIVNVPSCWEEWESPSNHVEHLFFYQ
nr:hypothetical protein [Crucivirus sp.]